MIHRAVAICTCLFVLFVSPSEAKQTRSNSQTTLQCAYDNDGQAICRGSEKRAGESRTRIDANGNRAARRDVTFIPNPESCPRQSFCACGLAHYWGLGNGLNSVSLWPRVFTRAGGPGIGIAAVRVDRHHVMGIVGGGPGAWEVVDFNSGDHKSRRYIRSSFAGYFFVDPKSRVASQ
jgi:hypothetical protein